MGPRMLISILSNRTEIIITHLRVKVVNSNLSCFVIVEEFTILCGFQVPEFFTECRICFFIFRLSQSSLVSILEEENQVIYVYIYIYILCYYQGTKLDTYVRLLLHKF